MTLAFVPSACLGEIHLTASKRLVETVALEVFVEEAIAPGLQRHEALLPEERVP